jgi:hypothetical protein
VRDDHEIGLWLATEIRVGQIQTDCTDELLPKTEWQSKLYFGNEAVLRYGLRQQR